MSNEIVRVDHEALEQVTGKFQTHAQATSETVNALQRSYEPLKNGGWIGQGASAFYAEMDEKIFPAMRRLAAALEQAGKTTAEIRALMRSAEEDASAHFRNDSSGGGSGEATSGGASTGAASTGAGESGGAGSDAADDSSANDSSAGESSTGGTPADGSSGGGSAASGSTGGGAAADTGSGPGSGLPSFDDLLGGNDGGSGSGLGLSPDDNYFDDANLHDGSGGNGSFDGDGDYTVPADWLNGVDDAFGPNASLNDYWSDDYTIPADWLSPVMDGVAQDLGLTDQGFGVNDLPASSMPESSGMGSGGGGGGPSEPPTEPEAETEREPTPASSGGGGSGGGNTPLSTNFAGRGNIGVFPYVSGEGTTTETTSAPARFHYQSTGGGAVTVPERAEASFVLMDGGSPAAAAQTPSGPKTPLIMALASPLLALVGRAVKNKMEDR